MTLNYQNQSEILGACKCGWQGKVPTELVVNMGDQRLLCPSCYADFNAVSIWAPNNIKSAPRAPGN